METEVEQVQKFWREELKVSEEEIKKVPDFIMAIKANERFDTFVSRFCEGLVMTKVPIPRRVNETTKNRQRPYKEDKTSPY